MGHAVGLHHVTSTYDSYTLYATNYYLSQWWEKTSRRSLEEGDELGKIYQAPSIPGGSSSQQYAHLLLGAPSTIDVSGTFTVGAGKTLEIEPTTTLEFASGKKLIINGTLEAEDATFTASGSSWGGITFNSGSSGDIDQSTIEDVSSIAAIQITNASPTISSSTISSSTIGISVSGSSSSPSITNTSVTSSSYGLRFYDAGGTVSSSTITNTGQSHTGVITSYYADPQLSASGNDEGNNKIYGFYTGLWAETAATIWNGSGENCVYNNTSYDAFAMDGGAIYAENLWWGGGAPYADSDGSSTVDYTPYLTDSFCPAPGAGKMEQEVANGSPESNMEEDLVAQLRGAKWAAVEGRHAEAIRLFKGIVTVAPVSKEAGVALTELGRLARKTDNVALATYLRNEATVGSPHRAMLLGLLVSYHGARKDRQAALAWVDTLEQEYPRTWQAFYGQWKAFHLYLEDGDYAEAAQVLARMQPTRDTDTYELALAQELLAAATGADVAEIPHQSPAKQGNPQTSVQAASYPNPFNPSATIRYSTATDSHIELIVYDVLGREVIVLVDGMQRAGIHQAIFKAGHLPSGTYIYRLKADGQIQTGMMQLVK